jgi:TolA-binding protein
MGKSNSIQGLIAVLLFASLSLCALAPLCSCASYAPQARRYDEFENKKAQMKYDVARGYMQKQDYASAVRAYRAFLDAYRDSFLADDAQMNVAECFEKLGQVREAVNEYGLVAADYPQSELAPSAQVKTGELLEKLDRWEDAVNAYTVVLEKYYFSAAAPEAKKRIDGLLERHTGSSFAAQAGARVDTIVKDKEKR